MLSGAKSRREVVFASFFAILGFLVFFHKVLFRAQEFLLRDLSALDLPLRHVLLECTRTSGWPPLWNPFFAGGQPLAANPHLAVFHPLSFLFYILPWHWAFSLQVLLPLAAGFWGMFVFLRRMGCSGISALFGALAWTFGGYGLSLCNLLPMLWTIAPLPWALSYALRLAENPRSFGDDRQQEPPRPRSGAVIGFSLSLALIFLGAEPQSIMACCTSIGLFVLFRFSWFRWKSGLAGFGLSALLALGLAACILLPATGLTLKTVRGTRMLSSPDRTWSLPATRLLELVSPPLIPWPDDHKGDVKTIHPLYPKQEAPLVGSLYCGLAVAVFAMFGFFRRFREHILEVSLIVVGTAMALGAASPLWSAASTIPIMRVGRYPEKWSLLLVLGMILCASQTLDKALEEEDPQRRKSFLRRTLGIGAVLSLLRIGADATIFRSTSPTYAFQVLLSLCLGCLFLSMVLNSSKGRYLKQGLLLTSFFVLMTGFAVSNSRLIPTRGVKELLEIPRFLSPLANRPDVGRLFHVADLRSQIISANWMAPPPSTAIWNIRTIFERDFDSSQLRWSNQAREMNLQFIADHPQLTTRQLARYGVGFIAELLNRKTGDPSQLAVGLAPVSDPEALVSCVDRVLEIPTRKDWAATTLDAWSESESSFVVMEGNHSKFPQEPSPCNVQILLTRPDRLDFVVDAKGPDLSVVQVNQTWDPGWQLKVDGSEGVLFRSDICFSSFSVPPGKHDIKLEYHNPLVRVGMGLSTLTSVLILILIGINLWRQRSHDQSSTAGLES